MLSKIRYPLELNEVASRFRGAGFQCFLVGGAVRDQLLGLKAKDYDLATDAEPENVMKLFRKIIPSGIKHGTVTLLYKGEQYEITTFRVDGKYTDGRRPDRISYAKSIIDDLKRRDFTINSIAFDLLHHRLVDPNKGQEDLKRRIIRAIGNPLERFDEDGLRAVRACRFASQLNFEIEHKTLEGIKKSLVRIPGLSRERIYDELIKIMKTEHPSLALKLFRDTGMLEILFPDLQRCVGVEQKGFHHYDVFEHSLYSCDGIPSEFINIRLAALFHDIGKPIVMKIPEGSLPTFHNHEQVSSEIAVNIMKQYRFSNLQIKQISHLIKHHMFHYTEEWSDAAVRRFISRVGKENIRDLFILRKGDIYGMQRHFNPYPDQLENFTGHINRIIEESDTFGLKDLAINGNDLMKFIEGIKGKQLGDVLNYLLECVLEDPTQNKRDELLNLAGKRYRQINGDII